MKRNGSLNGIPYDTRPPTMARLKFTYWSADNPRFFPPKVSGLGWGIDFYWLVHRLRWLNVRQATRPISGASKSGAASDPDSTTA